MMLAMAALLAALAALLVQAQDCDLPEGVCGVATLGVGESCEAICEEGYAPRGAMPAHIPGHIMTGCHTAIHTVLPARRPPAGLTAA